MLNFNAGYNTFDADSYTVLLEDRSEPELYRDIFPYDKAPRLGFNHRLVPMRTPRDIWITDTTFRDGQQSMPPYTVKQVVDLYKMLHRLGGSVGLIRQAEFFLYTRKDHPGVAEIQKWILAQYETGRTTAISDREMAEQVRLHLAGWLEQAGFELEEIDGEIRGRQVRT